MTSEISVTKWGSWHQLCYNLSHSLEDVILLGWVHNKKTHNQYMACIAWCNFYVKDGIQPMEVASPNLKFNKDELCELKTIPNGEMSCLDQDILIAIFAIKELLAIYQCTEKDIEIISPVEKHLQSLVPWIKWLE